MSAPSSAPESAGLAASGAMPRAALALAATLAAGIFFVIVVTPLDLKAQAVLGASVFLAALVLNRFRSRLATLALVGVSIAVSSRYMHWRLTATLDGDWSLGTAMAPLLLLAEAYTYVVLLLGYLQTAWPLNRRPAPMPDDPADWPRVDVFIPTYNEPLKVVRATVLAAKAIDWPADKLNVYLLDDGRRGEFRSFAAAAKVGYIARSDNLHAKAGNINHALERTSGEFVAIFDCDHAPTRSFLQASMGWFFKDPRLSLVQLPHHFYSPDPFERNLDSFHRAPNEGELFYGLIQPGNDLYNAAFFCGSCAVLRRQALEEVDGVATETVTEDAHTALHLHRKGWNSAFVGIPQASGLATESLSAHIRQRIRWARGMAQIFRLDNPLFGRGLGLFQRLCYANAMLHFFYGAPRLVFLLAPLAYLFFGAHIFNASPLMVLAYALPHLVHSTLTNSRIQGRFRHSFWAEVYETVLSFYILAPTMLALLDPKAGRFNVTSKGGRIERRYFDRRIALPYLLLLVLNLGGIAAGLYALHVGHERIDALLINLYWAMHNTFILGAALAVAWERRQVREFNRVGVPLPAMLRLESGVTLATRTYDLSLGGASVQGVGEAELAKDAPVSLSLYVGESEFPLAARVVERKGGRLRLAFDSLTLEEESWLVQAIFSRTDAWADWHDRHKPDRIAASWLSITGYGLSGLLRVFGGLVGRRRAAEEVVR